MTVFCFYEFGGEAWANILNGSYRIPFVFLKNYLTKYHRTVTADNVQDADVIFIYNKSHYADIVSLKNPNAYTVLVKPHVEIPFPVNPRYFRLSDIFNFLQHLLLYDIFNLPSIETSSPDFMSCKCMLSDTKQLALRYQSMGKNSIYFPLVENFDFLSSTTPKSLPTSNSRRLFYHGSRDNFIASLPFIKAALTPLSEFEVTLHVITNRFINLPKKIGAANVFYYKYSFSTLESLLKTCDLGLSPTTFSPQRNLISNILLPLIFPRLQKNMQYNISKLSENSGRSFLCAQAAMPFLTTPSPEFSQYFSTLSQTVSCSTLSEVSFLSKLFLSDSTVYSSFSHELLKFSSIYLDFDSLALQFVNQLIRQKNALHA